MQPDQPGQQPPLEGFLRRRRQTLASDSTRLPGEALASEEARCRTPESGWSLRGRPVPQPAWVQKPEEALRRKPECDCQPWGVAARELLAPAHRRIPESDYRPAEWPGPAALRALLQAAGHRRPASRWNWKRTAAVPPEVGCRRLVSGFRVKGVVVSGSSQRTAWVTEWRLGCRGREKFLQKSACLRWPAAAPVPFPPWEVRLRLVPGRGGRR
jgi:hypothetical protein